MVDAGEIKTTFETITYTHASSTTETDLVEYTSLKELITTNLDFVNLAQITTIKVYDKVDGTNYRLLSTKVYPTDYDTDIIVVAVILDGGGQDMKITLTSGTVEGSTKNIPANIRTENRE